MPTPSPEETAAAQRLGEAFLSFLLIHETARAQRRAAAEATRAAAPAPTGRRETRVAAPPQGLLDSRAAAKYLSISPRKVWELSSPRGPIPVVRVGVLVRYCREDLDGVIAAMTFGSVASTRIATLNISR